MSTDPSPIPASTETIHSGTPASGAHSTILAIALVAGLAELAYMLMNFSAMPVYLKFSLGYGETQIASIGTAFLLCEGLMKGPFGILGDRIGRKALLIGGPLVSVVTSQLTLRIQPDQWYLLVLLRVLDGLGAAALWPSALAMIADLVEEHKRSQAMSLFNVTYLIGVALGPFIGGVANDLTEVLLPHTDPKQASFHAVSVIFLATALVAWWRIPHLPPHHERHPHEEGSFSLRTLLESLRRIPATLLMSFVTFLGIGQIMLIIKLFALAEFGISEMRYGSLLLVPALVIAAASVPLGTLGDRIGKAKAVRLGIGVCGVSMWALILLRSQLALILGGSLIGVGFVIAFPAWMALVSSSCHPRERGAVMGAVGTAQGLGAMLGAPIGGYLYEHARVSIPALPWINSHYAPFIACAALLLCAWILATVTIKEKPQPC